MTDRTVTSLPTVLQTDDLNVLSLWKSASDSHSELSDRLGSKTAAEFEMRDGDS